MTKQNEALGWYGHMAKAWPVKQVGPMPSGDTLATVHGLGCRPGKQAMAIAMAMRNVGVTGSQIVIACGAPQLNKMRGLIADGMLKREAVPPQGETGHTVYKLTLTAKGAAKVKAADKVAADKAAPKPVKAKAAKPAAKPRKPAKAKAADTAANEAAAVANEAAAQISAAADKVTE